MLLCVVSWVRVGSSAKPFSLAEVSLTETVVYWRHYPSVEVARVEMKRRCAAIATQLSESSSAPRISPKLRPSRVQARHAVQSGVVGC